MKEGIHPDYKAAIVSCACGATYETHSTRGSFSVEVCASCHPFYTGRQKALDAKGRVDKFRKKYGTKLSPEALPCFPWAPLSTTGPRPRRGEPRARRGVVVAGLTTCASPPRGAG